jgi:hypothetical protein
MGLEPAPNPKAELWVWAEDRAAGLVCALLAQRPDGWTVCDASKLVPDAKDAKDALSTLALCETRIDNPRGELSPFVSTPGPPGLRGHQRGRPWDLLSSPDPAPAVGAGPLEMLLPTRKVRVAHNALLLALALALAHQTPGTLPVPGGRAWDARWRPDPSFFVPETTGGR